MSYHILQMIKVQVGIELLVRFLNHLFKILKALLRQSFKKCGVLVTCLIPGRLGLSSLYLKLLLSFGQWRPISLMGRLYKIFTKVIANRL